MQAQYITFTRGGWSNTCTCLTYKESIDEISWVKLMSIAIPLLQHAGSNTMLSSSQQDTQMQWNLKANIIITMILRYSLKPQGWWIWKQMYQVWAQRILPYYINTFIPFNYNWIETMNLLLPTHIGL